MYFRPVVFTISACIVYNIVDYGGRGNCIFLAVAGCLRSILPSSEHDHYSLRFLVGEWFKQNGLHHQEFIGAKPSEVIFDNPDQPPIDIFQTWTWKDWGNHIATLGVWGGDSEVVALNAVIGNGYKVNIHDHLTGVIYGEEHNIEGDKIILIQYKDGHYTALERADSK